MGGDGRGGLIHHLDPVVRFVFALCQINHACFENTTLIIYSRVIHRFSISTDYPHRSKREGLFASIPFESKRIQKSCRSNGSNEDIHIFGYHILQLEFSFKDGTE